MWRVLTGKKASTFSSTGLDWAGLEPLQYDTLSVDGPLNPVEESIKHIFLLYRYV